MERASFVFGPSETDFPEASDWVGETTPEFSTLVTTGAESYRSVDRPSPGDTISDLVPQSVPNAHALRAFEHLTTFSAPGTRGVGVGVRE